MRRTKKCLVEGGVWVNQPRSHYLSFSHPLRREEEREWEQGCG